MRIITFVTGNVSKAEQVGRHLNHPLGHKKLDIVEIQSLNLRDIIEHKAKEAFQNIGGPVLVEDTALIFNAMGKLPGPLIKWFLISMDNEGLTQILNAYKDRSALAQVCFGLYDGRELNVFEGEISGHIATSPKGEKGFGWDPIFIPNGYDKTWGEMSMGEQDKTSMRKIALNKLAEHLKANFHS